MEAWRDRLVEQDERLRAHLERARLIAVVGYKPGPAEAAHRIPAYLYEQGYRVIAVNPKVAGELVFGAPAVASLHQVEGQIDIVDIFRAPAMIPAHAEEILALARPPRLVFLQLGIRHPAASERLARAGIDVVQDRCLMVEHRRLLGPHSA